MSDGIGCKCKASCASECACDDVDWTPQIVYDLRDQLAVQHAARVSAEQNAILNSEKLIEAYTQLASRNSLLLQAQECIDTLWRRACRTEGEHYRQLPLSNAIDKELEK